MWKWMSKLLDKLSNYLAPRKGLLPMLGLLLIILNYPLQFLPLGWFSASDLLLHLGLVLAIFGMLLAWIL
jgi:hypothetical protein